MQIEWIHSFEIAETVCCYSYSEAKKESERGAEKNAGKDALLDCIPPNIKSANRLFRTYFFYCLIAFLFQLKTVRNKEIY